MASQFRTNYIWDPEKDLIQLVFSLIQKNYFSNCKSFLKFSLQF